jgi:hypothetical protein
MKTVEEKYLSEATKGMPNDGVIKKYISDLFDQFPQDIMDWAMIFNLDDEQEKELCNKVAYGFFKKYGAKPSSPIFD